MHHGRFDRQRSAPRIDSLIATSTAITTIHRITLPIAEPASLFMWCGFVIALTGATGAPGGAGASSVRHLSQPKRCACGCHVPGVQHVGQNGTACAGADCIGGGAIAGCATGAIIWRQ